MGASSPGEELSRTRPSPGGSSERTKNHAPKMGSDQWLFQISSDADEHAERSALSTIFERTRGRDSGQVDKRIIHILFQLNML